MPAKNPILQSHHVFEQVVFRDHPLVKKLVEAGYLAKDESLNRLYLPFEGELADDLDTSPHRGRTRSSYTKEINYVLNDILDSPAGTAAVKRKDAAALRTVAEQVIDFRDTVKLALINGDAFATTPDGMTAEQANAINSRTISSHAQYRMDNAEQFKALRSMAPMESEWAAVIHSDPRVARIIEEIQSSPRNLVAGPGERDAFAREVAGRMEMRLAISEAEQAGRLTLSDATNARVRHALVDDLPSIGPARGGIYDLTAPSPTQYKPVSQRGFVTMDLLIGEASASQLVRSGGLLASGADAILTTRRISEHLQQGNGTAAQSEFNHAVARSGGGWLGGMATASVIGTSSFVPAAVVAADALFMSKAFDKGADLLDNRAVYHQKDNAGVQWRFDGNNWQRQARMEDSATGPGVATEHSVGASYEKARELGAKASVSAVELALKDAPAPQDPFNLPARGDEGNGFGNPNWHRDAQTQQWTRQIKTDVVGANDRGIYETQTATPERAAELNQQAVQRIEDNIAHGKAAIAASYLENRAATRASDFVPLVPDAVEAARARPDAILGSDNVLYQRDEAGTWSHEGRVAQGNMALELEATRKIQQPSIEVLDRTLAALEARPAPTNAEMNRNEVRHGYASAGISPSPQWMEAIELATARTRAQHGITGATMQQLAPAVEGNAGESRAITHYQVGADGVAHPVATTTTEELRAAWREVRERAAQQAPVPDSPELRIAALSPREQEAYQQAMQEANRQGAATVDAGQAALAAAQQIQRGAPVATQAGEALADAQREQVQTRVPGPSEAIAPAVPPVAVPAPAAERETPEISRREGPRELRREPEPPREPELQQAEAQERAREVAEPPAAPAARTLHEPPAEIGVERNDAPHHAHAQNAEETRTHDSHEPERPRTPPVAPEPPPQPTPVPAVEHALEEQSIPPAAPVHEAMAEAPVAQNRTAEPVDERPAETAQHDDAVPSIAAAEEEAPTRAEPRTDTQAATPPPADALFGPAQPGHPDHALYHQVRQGIEALDAKHNRNFDHTSERMVASLTVLAKDNDLERVDHVLVSKATAEHPAGHAMFVVQGEPADPAHHRASMPTEVAAQTSVEESAQQFDVVSREAQQRAVANQMEQQLEDQRVQQGIQIRAASGGY
ncbi:XVIPCD domain-containing protein [Stenotrophomonas sp. 9(2022)]|uniref:XVIPCD domain-containing protein n=1 Tax=Stenotrophomonas sp. 9(2022) TaxID=2950153 RepID=UPI002114C7E1|nr:XVIPCD domain-containing protein [Stenotrophomonas sp. 9(2022)]